MSTGRADIFRLDPLLARFVPSPVANLLAPPLSGGPDRPTFAFHSGDLWLQGVKLGVEFSY